MRVARLIDLLKDDLSRHGGRVSNPAFWALAGYRLGRWSMDLPPPFRWVTGKLYGIQLVAVEAATGILINREVTVGEALHLVHSGNIKIHPDCVIGDRVQIMNDVTLGGNMERPGAPTIGNDVFIGAGVKILGPIRIGDGARIRANSLVLQDVPAGATMMGVPARVVRTASPPAEKRAELDG